MSTDATKICSARGAESRSSIRAMGINTAHSLCGRNLHSSLNKSQRPASLLYSSDTVFSARGFDQLQTTPIYQPIKGRFFAYSSVKPAEWEESEPDDPTALQRESRFAKHHSRILLCFLAVCVVLLINIVLMVTMAAKKGLGIDETQILYQGDCKTVGSLNTSAHLIVNMLSTILLASSNYSIQYLSAPTWDDVDRAHSKRKWLDIGVLSTHNLRCIQIRRILLWCLLGMSSLPLHLL